jgi:hypothetical protein
VKLTGDWAAATRLLTGAGRRVAQSIDSALRAEAFGLQREIVLGLRDQSPGGSPIRPLAETTIAKRRMKGFRGTKALIERADLLRSVTTEVRNGIVFVGVARKARLASGEAAVDIAERNEFGGPPVVIKLTDKSRRFLFALLAQASGAGGGTGDGDGIVVVRTPARPFLQPAFDAYRKGSAQRFLQRVGQGFFR